MIPGGLGYAVTHLGFDGSGFSGTASVASGFLPIGCVVHDFDGDGCDDIAIVNFGSHDVTVALTVAPALAESFGVGCPGPGGAVPKVYPVGLPVLGSGTFMALVTRLDPNALALVVFSASLANVPLGGGCQLYPSLAAPILIGTAVSSAGTALLALPVPASGTPGLDVYLQWAAFSTVSGSYVIALSDGLRLQVGS